MDERFAFLDVLGVDFLHAELSSRYFGLLGGHGDSGAVGVFDCDQDRVEFGLVPAVLELERGRNVSALVACGLVEGGLRLELAIEEVVRDRLLLELSGKHVHLPLLERIRIAGLELNEVADDHSGVDSCRIC